MDKPFKDRRSAGRVLARKLGDYAGRPDVVVLGLAAGGVAVAYEVARALRAHLDVLPVRNLGGAPDQDGTLHAVTRRERRELARRARLQRADTPELALADQIVILVDDGLATAPTMRVAVAALRKRHPAKLVIALPVAAPSTRRALRELADDVICVAAPLPLRSVGAWYADFPRLSDDDVRELLQRAAGDGTLATHYTTPASGF